MDTYCSKYDLPFKKSQNSVCYDCCNKWLHLKYSGLTVYQLELIKNDTWFCKSCYNDIFSFHNIDSNKPYKCLDIKRKQLSSPEIQTYSKCCGVCHRNVPQPHTSSIPCNCCAALIHKKCNKLTKKEERLLHEKKLPHWEYDQCKSIKFPFTNIDNGELLIENFNSIQRCKCKTRQFNPLNNEMKLLLNISQENEHSKYTHQTDLDFEQYAEIKPNFKYYNVHDFHNLTGKTSTSKTLSIC